VLILDRGRLGDRRLHVAEVDHRPPEPLQAVAEAGVADRGGPHVDAAAARAEVEWSADDGDRPERLRHHRVKASFREVSGGGGQTSSDGLRVVVADDDAAFVEALVLLVNGQPGLTVAGAAKNGLEAIELVESLEPEAVVIDLHMPLLDGVSAVARLRKDHPNLCLIALTGDPDTELHDAVREAGADAVLQKGELVETLFDRLQAVKAASKSG